MELLVGRETFLLNFIYKYVGITLSSHLDSLEFTKMFLPAKMMRVNIKSIEKFLFFTGSSLLMVKIILCHTL